MLSMHSTFNFTVGVLVCMKSSIPVCRPPRITSVQVCVGVGAPSPCGAAWTNSVVMCGGE